MKKVCILLSAAFAGLLAFSCAKEVNQENVKPVEGAIHFKVQAHGGVNTRTSVLPDGSFVKWDENDGLKIVETLTYSLSGETSTETHYGSAGVCNLQDDGKKADFDAYVEGNPPAGASIVSASYVAAYPYCFEDNTESLTQGGNPNKFWRMRMPAVQKPGVGTFDPYADILLSAPGAKDDNSRVEEGDVLGFSFHRIGTAVKMTVKGLETGEKLQKIVITAPVNIVGYVKVDLTTGDYLDDPGTYSGAGSNVLTLNFNDLAINGPVEVWFRVLAVDWEGTLEMTAETDAANYYRTTSKNNAIDLTSPMVFADGGLTKFSVNMGRERVPKTDGTVYTKVTSQDEIGEGANYIVAYLATDDATTATVMGPKVNDKGFTDYVSGIAIANNGISIQNEEIQIVTLEAAENEGEFYVLFDNQYLSCSASNASLALSDNKLTTGYDIWCVTPTGIVNTTAKKNDASQTPYEIRWNTGNSPRFANYAGTMGPIKLFKNGEVHPIPAIVTNLDEIADVSYKGGSFNDLNYTLKNLEGEAVITCDGDVVTSARADSEMEGRIIYFVSPTDEEVDREGWIKITVGTGADAVVQEVPVFQHGAPSHTIVLDGVEDGRIYVGYEEGDEAEFDVNSSYAWVANYDYTNGVNDSYLIDPEQGNADDEESDVTTITVSAYLDNNTGAERFLGTITIDNGADIPTTVEVWQHGFNGDGTLAHPFNIAGVKAYIDGGGNDNVYVAGKVSSATGGIAYPYDAEHGTATFYISDDGTTNAFEAYQVYFFDNEPWVNGNTQIAVGDEVILYGKVTYYSTNSVYETIKKEAYLYSLNGVTSETVPTIYVTDVTDVPAAGVTNATTAVSFANSDGWTASVTPDNTIVTAASISGTTVTYTVAENTGGSRSGSIVVTLTKNDDNTRSLSKTISVAQVAAEGQSSTKTYQHIFTTKPSVGNNVSLSNVAWNITATNLNNYNNGYQGVQFGTSSKSGSITLTSSAAWSYQGATKISKVRIWLNAGSGTPSATVTIGGVAATSDGTVVQKNLNATSYEDATCVTYTPGTSDTGVVVINATCSKAGYICAIEIDCE